MSRPSSSTKTRFPPSRHSSTNSRTRVGPCATCFRPSRSISTLKWPELASTAPSFIARMCSTRTTCVFPVRVTKTSPIRAASAIGTTLNPSICASSAFSGSISVTITFPPAPRARCANPRPHHVRAVIQGHVGTMRQGGADVVVVCRVVFALDREDLNAVILDQVGGDVVLRGQRVRPAQRDVGAPRLQGDGEVRGFCGDVETGGEAATGERALQGEAFPEQAQHRHRSLRPLGAAASFGSQAQVFYVGGGGASRRGHALTFFAE